MSGSDYFWKDSYKYIQMNGKCVCYDDESDKCIRMHDKYEYYFDDDTLYSHYEFIKLTNTVELFAIIKSIIIDIDEFVKLDILKCIVQHIMQSNELKNMNLDHTLHVITKQKDKHNISDEELLTCDQLVSVLKRQHDDEHVNDIIRVITTIITDFIRCIETKRDVLYEIYDNISRVITSETNITDVIKLFDSNVLLSHINQLLTACEVYETYMACLRSEFDSKNSLMDDILYDVSIFILSGMQEEAGHLTNFLDVKSHMYEHIYYPNSKRHLHIRPDLFKNNMDILAFIKEEFNDPQTFQFDYM